MASSFPIGKQQQTRSSAQRITAVYSHIYHTPSDRFWFGCVSASLQW